MELYVGTCRLGLTLTFRIVPYKPFLELVAGATISIQNRKQNYQNNETIRQDPASCLVVVGPAGHPSVHGPRVHRRSAVSLAVASRSASTLSQVRPGTAAHDE